MFSAVVELTSAVTLPGPALSQSLRPVVNLNGPLLAVLPVEEYGVLLPGATTMDVLPATLNTGAPVIEPGFPAMFNAVLIRREPEYVVEPLPLEDRLAVPR